MRTLILGLCLVLPPFAAAKILNVEYKFTPYTGDRKQDHVKSVPGQATVFINNIPFADQPVREDELPVMFDEREIAPAVWIPTESVGPLLRKGKNTIRIEFEPTNAKTPYHASLSWASVTDQVQEEGTRSTNQADEGSEDKQVTGKVVLEKTFIADFASDQPWHHYPPVSSLTDDDKQKLAALAAARAELFKPDFAGYYAALAKDSRIKVDDVKKMKCLDAVWKAGLRIKAMPADKLDFVTTGGPEVIVRAKGGGDLWDVDKSVIEHVKDDEMQMCSGIALAAIYQPRLVAVRAADGTWSFVP